MRAAWPVAVALLSAAAVLAGCADGGDDREVTPPDVGYDPSAVEVASVRRAPFTVRSFDGTNLSAVAYVPQLVDAVQEGPMPWPAVVFLHGWGDRKEDYEGVPDSGLPSEARQSGDNRLRSFAEAGFIAVAYDARGFGQSGGRASAASPSEIADLRAVLDAVEERFSTSGRFGVAGLSYGAGQALLAAPQDPRIQAVFAVAGWADLYESLLPGNVPKLAWAQGLYWKGLAASGGGYDPIIHDWYRQLYTRDDLGRVREQMDQRSPGRLLPQATAPTFLCQGMQETLFPQVDQVWEASGSFTRAVVTTGGHTPGACWDRSLDWFRFFLAGFDTGVDGWPALETVDAADPTHVVDYAEFPISVPRTYHLRDPDLASTPTNATFTIQQRAVSSPFTEPSLIWDQTGSPYSPLPEQLREDPAAVFFASPPFEEAHVLLGAPVVRLRLPDASGNASLPFQVTAALYQQVRNEETGRTSSLLLSHGAAAALDPDDVVNGTLELRLHWVKSDLAPGDGLVLRLSANDPSWYMPLAQPYEATFDGRSVLEVPFHGEQ